jgi:transposase InsO family protein
VVTRFGIPHALVTDNRKQFDWQPFRNWCEKLKIRNFYSSPRHPQANGQVEITNKTLFRIIKNKKKLEDRKGAWAEELYEALWACRTTARTPTDDTPFHLAFGSKVIIPVEVGSTSTRVQYFNPAMNDEGLKLSLDLLEERREKVSMTIAA